MPGFSCLWLVPGSACLLSSCMVRATSRTDLARSSLKVGCSTPYAACAGYGGGRRTGRLRQTVTNILGRCRHIVTAAGPSGCSAPGARATACKEAEAGRVPEGRAAGGARTWHRTCGSLLDNGWHLTQCSWPETRCSPQRRGSHVGRRLPARTPHAEAAGPVLLPHERNWFCCSSAALPVRTRPRELSSSAHMTL
jgi:hypothetical protein